jgi:hypothetical protein
MIVSANAPAMLTEASALPSSTMMSSQFSRGKSLDSRAFNVLGNVEAALRTGTTTESKGLS